MPRVIVLGVDPGSRRCGFGLVGRVGARLALLDSGVIAPGDLPMPERLARILEALAGLLAGARVDAVAVETAFCGLSPRSALALGQARGVALAVAARARLPVFEYAPAEVKRAFTGSGRADKAQMVRTARRLFAVDARTPDEADAIAIAVCHLARARGLALAARPERPRGAGRGAPSGAAAAPRAPAVDARSRLRPAVRRFGEVA